MLPVPLEVHKRIKKEQKRDGCARMFPGSYRRTIVPRTSTLSKSPLINLHERGPFWDYSCLIVHALPGPVCCSCRYVLLVFFFLFFIPLFLKLKKSNGSGEFMCVRMYRRRCLAWSTFSSVVLAKGKHYSKLQFPLKPTAS